VLRLLSSGRRDRTFAAGQLVRLRALGANQLIGAGLQSGRRLVLLGAGGECFRTCPSPRTTLIRFLGGDSASRCGGLRATIVGTRHGEKLVGTPHRDVIAALAGNDLVKGRGGDDLICGGRGDDRLFAGKGRDVLRGGAGRNRLHR
jgi:Ca2+-binding RTX toxin-like protein